MTPEGPDARDIRGYTYHVERLDDVSTRLARLEGRMDLMASREDVANAKYSMTLAWIGIAVAVLVGAVSIAVRFWPG